MAVERMKNCDSVVGLAEELGIHRRLLYLWRERLERGDGGRRRAGNSEAAKLRKQVGQLQRMVAEKMLELDFFKGALQKVEARRQDNNTTGEKASTTKSKK